jgi:hypothetical protein
MIEEKKLKQEENREPINKLTSNSNGKKNPAYESEEILS